MSIHQGNFRKLMAPSKYNKSKKVYLQRDELQRWAGAGMVGSAAAEVQPPLGQRMGEEEVARTCEQRESCVAWREAVMFHERTQPAQGDVTGRSQGTHTLTSLPSPVGAPHWPDPTGHHWAGWPLMWSLQVSPQGREQERERWRVDRKVQHGTACSKPGTSLGPGTQNK